MVGGCSPRRQSRVFPPAVTAFGTICLRFPLVAAVSRGLQPFQMISRGHLEGGPIPPSYAALGGSFYDHN